MSFFVSKEISDIVDESCLIEDTQSEESFSIILGSSQHNIEEAEFKELSLSATIKVGLKSIISLITENEKVEIVLGSKQVKTINHKIIKIKRNSEDNYSVELICFLEKGLRNV